MSKSDIVVDDTRACEVGTVTFQGKEFSSGGFFVDMEHGRMVAYVHKAPEAAWIEGRVTSYWLQTWNGEVLAPILLTGESRTGFHGTKLQSFRTLRPIVGWHWYGRELGAGMMLRLRKGRKAQQEAE